IMASAFHVEAAPSGVSRVCVCIFGAVHVDLTADLRAGNPSAHPAAIEAHSVRECGGECRFAPPQIRVIVDLSGAVWRGGRDAMRNLLASHRPEATSSAGA